MWWAVLILSAVLLVFIMSAKLRGEVPKIFGYSVMRIVSGSMEPEIPKDSYILVKETAPEDIKKSDIICFYSDDPMIYGFPNTHRVVEEPYVGEDGDYHYVTAGDNSHGNDSVSARGERLIGRYVGQIGVLNALESLFTGRSALIVILSVQGSFLVLAIVWILRSYKQKKTIEDNTEK